MNVPINRPEVREERLLEARAIVRNNQLLDERELLQMLRNIAANCAFQSSYTDELERLCCAMNDDLAAVVEIPI